MNYELLNRNKNINRGFRKLEVWQEAIELFAIVKHQLDGLKSVSFKVKAQIEDSILSVFSNIAEGYSRRSIKENIQYVTISLASLSENYTQIFALLNAGVLNRSWFDEYDNKLYSLENKLIQLNRSMIAKPGQNDWQNDYKVRELITPYKS